MQPGSPAIRIAGRYTVEDWKRLQLDDPGSADWRAAGDIFETRIRKRYLEPIESLIAQDRAIFEALGDVQEPEKSEQMATFGFAILALDCVLIEAIQGACEGLTAHRGESKDLVARFLQSHFTDVLRDRHECVDFYEKVRCELLHRASIGGDLRVTANNSIRPEGWEEVPPLFDVNGIRYLNRNAFHGRVQEAFAGLICALRGDSHGFSGRTTTELRLNVRTVMDALCA